MTLNVDFNMRDREGRVVVLLDSDQRDHVHVGDLVLAEDAEGNRCKALVEKLATNSPTVAHISLQPGTAEPSPKSDWLVELR